MEHIEAQTGGEGGNQGEGNLGGHLSAMELPDRQIQAAPIIIAQTGTKAQ